MTLIEQELRWAAEDRELVRAGDSFGELFRQAADYISWVCDQRVREGKALRREVRLCHEREESQRQEVARLRYNWDDTRARADGLLRLLQEIDGKVKQLLRELEIRDNPTATLPQLLEGIRGRVVGLKKEVAGIPEHAPSPGTYLPCPPALSLPRQEPYAIFDGVY